MTSYIFLQRWRQLGAPEVRLSRTSFISVPTVHCPDLLHPKSNRCPLRMYGVRDDCRLGGHDRAAISSIRSLVGAWLSAIAWEKLLAPVSPFSRDGQSQLRSKNWTTRRRTGPRWPRPQTIQSVVQSASSVHAVCGLSPQSSLWYRRFFVRSCSTNG